MFRKKQKAPQMTGKIEYMVVGLGNPGGKYDKTRHNAGFLSVDLIWEKFGFGRMTQTKCRALYGACIIGEQNVLVMKPQTFMNLSGEAVRDIARSFKIELEHIIVVYDDVALPAGKLRLRPSGSDGGHNGIKSIIYCLGTNVFPRVKIGVGAPDKEGGEDLADYVLDTIDKASVEAIAKVPDIVYDIITQGLDTARQKNS